MKGSLAVILGIQLVSMASLCAVPWVGLGPPFLLGLLTSILLAIQLRPKKEKQVPEDILEAKVAERTGQLAELVTKFEKQAMTDALTGLLNRRGGEDSIKHHIARSIRVKTAISFILLDIDHFKKINDEYGHGIGDSVISGVANIIKVNLRESDFAIRWGGEEYLVVLPDTDLVGAMTAAEKVRQAVERNDFGTSTVTVSLGVAELGRDPFELALARADMHLYFAKSKGRNQVFPNSLQKVLDES